MNCPLKSRRKTEQTITFVFLSPVPFEGDASWQHWRSLKINGAEESFDSFSAGCSSPGWPDWSWMSLLLLNLVYVKQPDLKSLRAAQCIDVNPERKIMHLYILFNHKVTST